MKTALLKVSLLSLIAIAFIGCGGSKTKSAGSGAAVVPPGTGDNPTTPGTGGQTTWPFSTTGETVAFSPVSWQEMNQYVAIRPLNNPSNAKINIHMKRVAGTQFYSGKIQIGYTDSNQFYFGAFTAGEGRNVNCQNCRDNGLYEAAPNFWHTIGGVRTFMAYVQDQYGALIIVMEPETNTPDAESSMLKGRIYYRNFANNTFPQSTFRKCWYIYSGPYACYSNNMSQKLSSTDFGDGTYRLLGYFSGVRASVALTQ
ncbi:MAG: hypothetical protein ACK5Y2_05105 [Bdellovibrionales bacterium]